MDLGARAVRAALERCPGLEPDYVAVGNVLQAANGQNPGRRAALAGGVRRDVPGITLNDVCLASMSAVALGHPLAGSGLRLVLTLADELRRRGGGLGVAALCGGGGQGEALLLAVN